VRTEVGDAHADVAWTLPLIGAALAIGLIVTQPSKLVLFPGEVSDAEALSIVQTRCAACHAEYPTDATIKVAPKGVHLETLDQMKRYSAQVWVQAVANKAMPLANRTGITDEERAKLGTWIARQ
jgi:uncharacterized membrane protein